MIPPNQLEKLKPLQDQVNRRNQVNSKRRISYKTNHTKKRRIERNLKRVTLKGRLTSTIQVKRQIQRAFDGEKR